MQLMKICVICFEPQKYTIYLFQQMVVWACIFAKHAVLQNPFNVSCLLAYPCVYIYNIYIYIYGWWFQTAVTAQRLSRSAADLSRALGGTVSPCFLPCLETFPWTLVVYQMGIN